MRLQPPSLLGWKNPGLFSPALTIVQWFTDSPLPADQDFTLTHNSRTGSCGRSVTPSN